MIGDDDKVIKIFTVTHRKFSPLSDKIYIPIHAGAAIAKEQYGYIGDDIGTNISERNCYYGELTVLYWIWKNEVEADYLGLCHYRRYFVSDANQPLKEEEYRALLYRYDALVCTLPAKGKSFYERYKEAHYIKDLDITRQVLQEKYPEYEVVFDKLMNGDKIYIGNLFVANAERFKEYAEWLFTILFEVEKRIDVSNYDDYHKRVFGFLAEQLLGVWVTKNQLEVCELPFGIFQEKMETLELKEQLRNLTRQGKLSEAITLFEQTIERRPDLLLQASDLSNELQDMYNVLILCMQEVVKEVDGIWNYTHDLDELVQIRFRISEILLNIWKDTFDEVQLDDVKEKHISWVAMVMVILN